MGFLCWIFIIFFLQDFSSITHGSQEPQIPPHGYDRTETGLHGEALNISLSLHLETGLYIGTEKMEFQFNVIITQYWLDSRLVRNNHHVVILTDRTTIWTPDLYCHNCIGFSLQQTDHDKQTNLIITEHGHVSYSQTVPLIVSCLFQFHDFPFDIQQCSIQFSSYSYNTSYIDYNWKERVFLADTELEQFSVANEMNTIKLVKEYYTGNYSSLIAEVKFIRQCGYYIFRLYLPSFILVCLSWMVFSISPTEVGDRLAISITLMLSMLFLLGYVDSTVPKVSYIKALDWYLIVSLIFIIASIIETVIVYVYLRNKVKTKEKTEEPVENEKQIGESSNYNQGNSSTTDSIDAASRRLIEQDSIETIISDARRKSSIELHTHLRKVSAHLKEHMESHMTDENLLTEPTNRLNARRKSSSVETRPRFINPPNVTFIPMEYAPQQTNIRTKIFDEKIMKNDHRVQSSVIKCNDAEADSEHAFT